MKNKLLAPLLIFALVFSKNGVFGQPAILLKDIVPGKGNSLFPVNCSRWHVAGNQLFFVRHTDEEWHELWVSDGTAGGFRLMPGIAPEVSKILGQPFIAGNLDGKLYFWQEQWQNQFFWQTDGSPAGLLQITPDSMDAAATHLVFQNENYFVEQVGNLFRLWKAAISASEIFEREILTAGRAAGLYLIKVRDGQWRRFSSKLVKI